MEAGVEPLPLPFMGVLGGDFLDDVLAGLAPALDAAVAALVDWGAILNSRRVKEDGGCREIRNKIKEVAKDGGRTGEREVPNYILPNHY